MRPLLFSLFESSDLSERLKQMLQVEAGDVTLHRFPDAEWYVKINSKVKQRDVIIVDSLNQPDQKILPLLFFVETLKALGARQVGLIAPYLPYLRQDKRFHAGEGITSRYFAALLSKSLDWLITIDPHLHRYKSLLELYGMPAYALHATANIAQWIKSHAVNPVMIGPDSESRQWVAEIADKEQLPYVILEKIRHGDKQVEISIPNIPNLESAVPILVDDIISTGRTMLETVRQLRQAGARSMICIGVHALFADDAYIALSEVTDLQLITCNTVTHPTNAIDVSDLLAEALIKNKLAKYKSF